MALYMISFDLNGHSSDSYNKIRDAIHQEVDKLGLWCRYLTTTYLLKSTYDIFTVEKYLTAHLTPSDRMIIVPCQKPIQGFLSQEEWAWINANL